MSLIELWAPAATSVKLYTPSATEDMTATANGWWRATSHLDHGQDYGFIVDDKGPFPDPRSRWQPQGVHGLSRVVDEPFRWNDDHWRGIAFEQSVIYELHVGTFSSAGTFRGVLDKLPYLKDLGVTHIELLPIAEFAGNRGWGYDGVQLFAPHHTYGTPYELKLLVNACHEIGLGIILDVVYNHLGPSGNYLGHFGPYFHDHYQTPWGQAVNFDGFDSPQVRRYFIDNALMWLRDYHFDGLRLDAVQTIMDGSAIHFLEQLASETQDLVAQTEWERLLIAESHMNDGRLMQPQEHGGYGLQAQWHDDFHHAIYAFLTGEQAGYFQDYGKIDDITTVLNKGVFFQGQYCRYRRRLLGRPATSLTGTNFIAYIQNHDQVGNRPGGERLCHLLNLGQMKIAAALLLTSPFIPMLFQGEEWGASTPFYYFTDHSESKLGNAIKRGRKQEALEFGWPIHDFSDPQQPDSFQRSVLDWSELDMDDKQELLGWYQRLMRIRQRIDDLHAGPFLNGTAHADADQQVIQLTRGAIEVICNCSDQTRRVTLRCPGARLTLGSDPEIELDTTTVALPAYSVAVLDKLEMTLA